MRCGPAPTLPAPFAIVVLAPKRAPAHADTPSNKISAVGIGRYAGTVRSNRAGRRRNQKKIRADYPRRSVLSCSARAPGSAGSAPGASPYPTMWPGTSVGLSTRTTLAPALDTRRCSSAPRLVEDERAAHIPSANTPASAAAVLDAPIGPIGLPLDFRERL